MCLSDACPFSESAFVSPSEVFTHHSFHFSRLHWGEVVNITGQVEVERKVAIVIFLHIVVFAKTESE